LPKNLDWSSICIACYRLFAKYLGKDDSATKCKAMEAFGGLFLSQPRLVLHLDKMGLIDDVMSNEAVLPLQLESLDCWKKILMVSTLCSVCFVLFRLFRQISYPNTFRLLSQSEEQRIDGGEARAKMDSDGTITVSKKISGDQDGDATLFGGVLTNHSERLFEMTQSTVPQLRLSSLELVGLLLRQGLVRECFVINIMTFDHQSHVLQLIDR
jgi:cohesin loading factor subunit SCC2